MRTTFFALRFSILALLFCGCSRTTENKQISRTTRTVFLGERAERLSGILVGDVFISEKRLSNRQIQFLTCCETNKNNVENISVPFEGITWVDAMVYCEMIQTNSMVHGALKAGEVVRLPSVEEVNVLAQSGLQSLWFYDGVSNGVPPANLKVDAVYEWTRGVDKSKLVSVACFRHPIPEDRESRGGIVSLNSSQAYPNLIMRVVIAPEDNAYLESKEAASSLEKQIWDLSRKQRYHMLPYRGSSQK